MFGEEVATSIAFDTLKFARALREKAHLTTEQAEGLAEAITDAMHDDLATKADLAREAGGIQTEVAGLGSELKAEISGLRSELKAEIADGHSGLKSEMAGLRSELKAEIADVRSELKGEIAGVRSELKAKIAEVRSELKAETASVRSDIEIAKRDMKIWFGSVMVGAVSVILAAIRYLPPSHP